MKKTSLAILFLAAFVSAETQSVVNLLGFIALVFGVASLAYTYNRTQGKSGLEAQIVKNKKLILKQRKEIEDNKVTLEQQKTQMLESEKDKIMASRVSKSLENMDASHDTGIKKEFWDKITEIGGYKDEANGMADLLKTKKELQELINLTKSKYQSNEIDESTYNEITRDYHKRMIEVESKISKIQEDLMED